MPRLNRSQQRRIIQNATRELRRNRGRSRSGGLFQTLGGRFGPLGELIGMLGDILAGGRRVTRRNIEDAVRILSEQGFEVHPGGPPEAPPIVVQPPPVVRGPRGVPTTAPEPDPVVRPRAPQPRQPAATPWPAEHTVQTLPTRLLGAFERPPSDVTGFSPWVFFPESSNLHAAIYDYDAGVLYIQFRAAGKPIGYKDGVSLCSGKAYKIGIRADVPGPIYSYGGAGRKVPPEIFEQLVRARSAGKVVWDKLRVCGSQWQHRFPYTLTDVPQGQNVPRKATRRGLRVRTVPTVGLGRRGGRQSTLPERVR